MVKRLLVGQPPLWHAKPPLDCPCHQAHIDSASRPAPYLCLADQRLLLRKPLQLLRQLLCLLRDHSVGRVGGGQGHEIDLCRGKQNEQQLDMCGAIVRLAFRTERLLPAVRRTFCTGAWRRHEAGRPASHVAGPLPSSMAKQS